MSDMTTAGIDLDAIEARANAATAGPWSVGQRMNIEGPDPFCGRVIVANVGKCSGVIPDVEQEANSRLIAHARTDIPALITEVKRLRAALAGSKP